MRHFPIFLDTAGRRVALSGGGAAAQAKLRLLLKTEARIDVFAPAPAAEIADLADQGRLVLTRRAIRLEDVRSVALVYAANEDAGEDARVADLARAAGALVNIVDNLDDSAFITPAIVDRDPVTVAIGTEGAAPMLARAIKRDLEDRLPATLGLLARIGKAFRPMAEKLPLGRARRDFWSEYYLKTGPQSIEIEGKNGIEQALRGLLVRHLRRETAPGHVDFVGAGPGDPELLTLKARAALDRADVVIHDRLVAPEILDLARREATLIEAGKTGFGPSTPQAAINALIVEHARRGAHVVRLKSGDPGVFGRLDEEIEAVAAAGIAWRIVPGITAAAAAAASLCQGLTRRGRNSEVRLLTGHDVKGFAEADWRALARPGAVAAIYMGRTAARFIQARLMMHGASPDTPASVVVNASRADQRISAVRLADLAQTAAEIEGPALTFIGLSPRDATVAVAGDANPTEIAS